MAHIIEAPLRQFDTEMREDCEWESGEEAVGFLIGAMRNPSNSRSPTHFFSARATACTDCPGKQMMHRL
jgi:hypothetical protein